MKSIALYGEEKMLNGLLARKLGMTQVFLPDGTFVPVTVLETGPCYIVQRRTKDNDGYEAVQLGFGEQKAQRVTKPLLKHFAKAGLQTPLRHLREFRISAEDTYAPGQEVKASDVFAKGDRVSVTGRSKGRGFQGVVRRHNFKVKPMSHGSRNHRQPGSIGTNTSPGRVRLGRKMPGHMGDARVTIRNLEVVDVMADKNLLLVKGAVPGATRSLVIIRK